MTGYSISGRHAVLALFIGTCLSPAVANVNFKHLLKPIQFRRIAAGDPNIIMKKTTTFPPQSSSAPSDSRRRLLATVTTVRVEENYTCSYKENDDLEYACDEPIPDITKCVPAPKWNCRVEGTGCVAWQSGTYLKCVVNTLYSGLDGVTCADFDDSIKKGKILSDAYHPGDDCDMSTDKMKIQEHYKCDPVNNYVGIEYTLNLTSGRNPISCVESSTCESPTVGKHNVKCSYLQYVASQPPPPSPPPASDITPTQSSFTYRYFDNPLCEGEAKAVDSVESGKRSTIPSWYIPDASGTNYLSIDKCEGNLCIVDSSGKEMCETNKFSYEKFCRQTSDKKRSFNVKECVDAQAGSNSASSRSTPGTIAVVVSLFSLLLTVFAN